MKIVFMGTPGFAVPTLESIVKAGHEVAMVVSMPDKRKGRGKKVQFTPVKEAALRLGLEVHQPEKLNNEESLSILEDIKPDVIVVVAYGQILRERVLNLPKYGCVNVHASVLPKYRGAAPINWVIINGEETTGITTMLMEKGLDTGDMLLISETKIGERENAGQLHDRLMDMGADLLVQTLDKLEHGDIEPEKQDHEKSCYAPMMDKTLGKIDWYKSAEKIDYLIRGTYPWPGAYTNYEDRVMKIIDAEPVEVDSKANCGEIIEVTKKYIRIKCKEGCLDVREIQMSGKKAMTIQAYLAGNSIEPGIVLT